MSFCYLSGIICFVHFFRWSYHWVTGPREEGSVTGSLLEVVVIHHWIATGTCDDYMRLICPTPSCDDNIMFVSKAVLSGIILVLRVDKLVTIVIALVDSIMMTQLCSLTGKVKNHQQCT